MFDQEQDGRYKTAVGIYTAMAGKEKVGYTLYEELGLYAI